MYMIVGIVLGMIVFFLCGAICDAIFNSTTAGGLGCFFLGIPLGKLTYNAIVAVGEGAQQATQDTKTPLIAAVRAQNIAEVERLLAQPELDINARDQFGNTALHYVQNRETMQTLLDRAADFNIRNGNGHTPFHHLVDGSIFHESKKVSLHECLTLLLAKGADINAGDNDGCSPLATAVSDGDIKTVEFLLRNGANVDTHDKNGRTPLHEANDAQITELLVQSGAGVNARDNRLRTPLFFRPAACMAVLIAAGADVNARDKIGRTPLFCVGLLVSSKTQLKRIAAKAVTEVRNEDGENSPINIGSFLSKIESSEQGRMLTALSNLCVSNDKAISDDDITSCVTILIEKGADIRAVDQQGKSVQIHLTEKDQLRSSEVRANIKRILEAHGAH